MKPAIFIQIAAYKDPELLPTMKDAVAKAKHPEALRFGICYQGTKDSPDFEAVSSFPNCRVIWVEPEAADGVCPARAMTQSLWQGEPYTLQIDSHMRFEQDWDETLLAMHRACGPKAILTAYCDAYQPDMSLSPNPRAYTLGADYFNLYGSLMLLARICLEGISAPVPGAFWSGHFSFAEGQVITDIPYDPELYFHGEEISYAVRAWTHGYNLFYPNQAVCRHYYERTGRTTHWDEHPAWFAKDMLSQQRVRRLLGMEPGEADFGRFGLGTQRSLEEYQAFSGVDFAAKSFSAKAFNGWYGDALPPHPAKNIVKPTARGEILFVTAFLEMGRENWAHFQRSSRLYRAWFSTLASLENLELVCYYEKDRWKELPRGNYTLRDFQKEDTFFRDYYEAEKEIMQNQAFRAWIGNRRANPEHSKPDYSMMTHCKANFLRRARQQYPGHSHYAWIDFGIAREPMAPDTRFDWRPLMDEKIHMQVFGKPEEYPSDPRELCRRSPDALSASMIVIPERLTEWYEEAYERELRENHRLMIADDEQNIMLRMAQKYPDKISADPVKGWYDFFMRAY